MRAHIVAIQADCPTPSTPLTPYRRKYLIFSVDLCAFWVQGIRLPYTYTPTQSAGDVETMTFRLLISSHAFDFVSFFLYLSDIKQVNADSAAQSGCWGCRGC